MKKTKERRSALIYFLILIVLLLALFFVFWLFSNKPFVNRQIEQANYCATDEDCIVIYFGCPFGCGSYINKNKERGIRRLVDFARLLHPMYNLCEYSCMRPPLPECESNRCVPKVCETGKYYTHVAKGDIHYWECACPEGTRSTINDAGLICSK